MQPEGGLLSSTLAFQGGRGDEEMGSGEQIFSKGSSWPVAKLPITLPTVPRESASGSALGTFSTVRTRVC